jgi:hypothetical protein
MSLCRPTGEWLADCCKSTIEALSVFKIRGKLPDDELHFKLNSGGVMRDETAPAEAVDLELLGHDNWRFVLYLYAGGYKS